MRHSHPRVHRGTPRKGRENDHGYDVSHVRYVIYKRGGPTKHRKGGCRRSSAQEASLRQKTCQVSQSSMISFDYINVSYYIINSLTFLGECTMWLDPTTCGIWMDTISSSDMGLSLTGVLMGTQERSYTLVSKTATRAQWFWSSLKMESKNFRSHHE